ncbi:hypothetical protein GCM10010349_14330 [Streptomyces flavofungini]|nr:hypothetical protein GCM10010349_14330 [Streptomyces flavofungini]
MALGGDTAAELAGIYDFGTQYNPDGTVQSQSVPAAGGLGPETLTCTYDDLQLRAVMTAGGWTYAALAFPGTPGTPRACRGADRSAPPRGEATTAPTPPGDRESPGRPGTRPPPYLRNAGRGGLGIVADLSWRMNRQVALAEGYFGVICLNSPSLLVFAYGK